MLGRTSFAPRDRKVIKNRREVEAFIRDSGQNKTSETTLREKRKRYEHGTSKKKKTAKGSHSSGY